MELDNKVAVVTGGKSGLGHAVVERFLKSGVKVAVFDLEDRHYSPGKIFESRYKSYHVDVTDRESILKALSSVSATWGAIHICVNCAGIAPAKKILDRHHRAMPAADFENTLSVNLVGTFNMCSLVAEKMAENSLIGESNERGIIINTASIAAFEGQKGQCAYAASKGAIVSMTLPMARDLGGVGIRVVTIAPGVMGTPMMLAMDESVQSSLESSIPFPKRMGFPKEFASLAEHVVENAYINGEVIRLDGALRMH